MKKIILFLTVVLMTACSTVINDTETYAIIEDIHYSNCKEYKYVVTAWQYQPKLKKYRIYTDSLYKVNSFITLKNKEVK